jgi:hypothetical protein
LGATYQWYTLSGGGFRRLMLFNVDKQAANPNNFYKGEEREKSEQGQ